MSFVPWQRIGVRPRGLIDPTAGNNHGPVVRLALPLATRAPRSSLEIFRSNVITRNVERRRARRFKEAHGSPGPDDLLGANLHNHLTEVRFNPGRPRIVPHRFLTWLGHRCEGRTWLPAIPPRRPRPLCPFRNRPRHGVVTTPAHRSTGQSSSSCARLTLLQGDAHEDRHSGRRLRRHRGAYWQ